MHIYTAYDILFKLLKIIQLFFHIENSRLKRYKQNVDRKYTYFLKLCKYYHAFFIMLVIVLSH